MPDIQTTPKTTNQLLAAIGVTTEPHPEYGCKMLRASKAELGPMDVRQAYSLLAMAEYAA